MKEIIRRYFLPWRLYTFLVGTLSVLFLPYLRDFNFLDYGRHWHNMLYLWTNFDGVHYLNIAQYGYGHKLAQFSQVFFPLYPLLIRNLAPLVGGYVWSGLFISHLSLLGALYFFQKLIRLDHSPQVTKLSLWLLLLFPTAFFFVSVYSESLFLLLVVASVYFARKKMFLLAAVIAALASATRIVGIFLLPVLLVEFWIANGKSLKSFFSVRGLIPFISVLGLLLYMRYLAITTGDPVAFSTFQPLVSAQREVGKLILLHQVFYRYARMMVFVDHTSLTFLVALTELAAGISFLVLSLAAFRLRLSYGLFALGAYLLPTLTGTLNSMPRFALAIFPAFIVLARWLSKRPKFRWGWLILSLLLQTYFLILFATGHFIA